MPGSHCKHKSKVKDAWCKTDTSVLVSFRPKWNLASDAGVSKDLRFTWTVTITKAMMMMESLKTWLESPSDQFILESNKICN